ncbi:hypothetical protein [Octadecabacter sp. R77987]|uniref:hypothetical protein n=1 Tax=Octadecabacter sp. R77987 TaxID=3093874 RepID=UPI00366B9262
MTRWPAIHTTVGGQRHLTGRIYAGLLALMLIVVPACGVMVAVVAGWMGNGLNGSGPMSVLALVGVFLGYSPILSWAGLLIGMPLSVLAMSKGKAGWLVALAAGAIAGGLIGLLLQAVVVTAPFGALFGGLYWLFTRWLAPAALLLQLDQGGSPA